MKIDLRKIREDFETLRSDVKKSLDTVPVSLHESFILSLRTSRPNREQITIGKHYSSSTDKPFAEEELHTLKCLSDEDKVSIIMDMHNCAHPTIVGRMIKALFGSDEAFHAALKKPEDADKDPRSIHKAEKPI